ncbi:MAG TPA: folate-binding protein [Burkholderiaceae bacterium]|nr:folate-binding protein [Burkholderiaceae bacterium]
MNTTVNTVLNGIAPLPHQGIIRVEGEDAATFLHGQLTQDFALLGLSEARLAAFCSAKGRMQASFIGFKRSNTEILLICSRDVLAPTLKRLSMFVMRAKARLTDATDQFLLLGLAGDTINLIATKAYPTGTKVDLGTSNVVFLHPADGVPRALWVAPVGEPLPAGTALSTELWQWGEVRSGIATITTPIVEAFVPQMLNYESVGGVNFKKGCYPGQEVVARSQFRGTLKRRAFLVHSDSAMTAGQEVFAEGDDSQPAATVAQAAAAPTGGFDAIISGQVAAVESSALHVGTASGPKLKLDRLPYTLLADV